MCLIIFDPRESIARLPKAQFKRAAERNSDGLGIMYPLDGKLHVWRSLTDIDGLWNRYTHARDNRAPVAVHFRMVSAGKKTLANCHPFEIVPRDFAFMHNGTMTQFCKLTKGDESDSHLLARELFGNLPGSFLSNPVLYAAVEDLARGDRFLFMDGRGNHTFINEKSGFWNEGCWYSSSTSKTYILTGENPTYAGSYSRYGSQTYYGAYGLGEEWDNDREGHTPYADHRSSRRSQRLADLSPKSPTDWYIGRKPKPSTPDIGLKSLPPAKTDVDVDLTAEDTSATDDKGTRSTIVRLDERLTPVVFDYAGWIEPNDPGFTDLGSCYLPGARLWAMRGVDGAKDMLQAGAIDSGRSLRVLGKAWAIKEQSAWDLLSLYDELTNAANTNDAPYRRTIRDIIFPGEAGEARAWTYMANVNHKFHRPELIIPFGDWQRFLDSQVLGPKPLKSGDECPVCKSVNTSVYSEILKYTSSTGLEMEVSHFWCRDCDLNEQLSEEEVIHD